MFILLGIAQLALSILNLGCGYADVSIVRQTTCLFLLGTTSFFVAWGLFRRKHWTATAQVASLLAGLVFFCVESNRHNGPNDLGFGPLFAAIWFVFLLIPGVPTLILLAYESRNAEPNKPSDDSPLFGWEEVCLLIPAIVLIAWGDFWSPHQNARAYDHRIEEENKENQAKFDARWHELMSAILSNDRKREGEARKSLDHSTHILRQYGEIENRFFQCDQKTQLALVEEPDGTYWDELPNLLDDARLDPVVRRRITVIKVKEYLTPSEFGRSLLGEVVTSRAVWLLCDAIADRETTSVDDRVLLAQSLEKVSDSPDYDVKPAVETLRKVVESDDPAVVVHAQKALKFATESDLERFQRRSRSAKD